MTKGWYLKDDESAIRLTLHKDDIDAELLDFTESELEDMLYVLRNPSGEYKLRKVVT